MASHIYNTTFGVDPAVEKEFIAWLRREFIPLSVDSGEYFKQPELLRVHTQDKQVNSIALHMRADDLNDINLWYEDEGARLFDFIQQTWQGRVVFFSTTLSVID